MRFLRRFWLGHRPPTQKPRKVRDVTIADVINAKSGSGRRTERRRRMEQVGIDFLLDQINAAKFVPLAGQNQHRLGRMHFNGCEPIAFFGSLGTLWKAEGSEVLYPRHRTPEQVWPIDVRVVSTYGDAPLDQEFSLQRIRSIDPKTIRGRTTVISPYVVEWATGAIHVGKRHCETRRDYWGWFNSGGWRYLMPPTARVGPDDRVTMTAVSAYASEANFIIPIALGISQERDRQWTVWLGFEGGPRILFPTTAAGARALFRLRDLPPDKDRRAALRHWVDEHYRHLKDIEDDEELAVFVRKHLRGATEFAWAGFECLLVPSPFDLRAVGMAKEARAVMKARGDHILRRAKAIKS